MRWTTAIQHLGRQEAIITQTWCGARLEIPYSLIPFHQEHLRLIGHRNVPLGEVAVTQAPLDIQAVEHLLREAGLPLTGWVPGYEHFMSPYNRAEIVYAILHTTRQIVQEQGREEVALDQLRARVGIKERTFLIHLLNLIEDGQGLIRINEQQIRLATWQEAMQASACLIASTQQQHNGDTIVPQCKLGLTDSATLSDWLLTAHTDKPFSLFQVKEPPHISFRGDAAALDLFIEELILPRGWAATYGENESENARLEMKLLTNRHELNA